MVPNEENFVRKSVNRNMRKIKTTKSQKQKMTLTPKHRNTMEPISHFRAHSKLNSKRMKGSMSMTGNAMRGIRGKSPFKKGKQKEERKSVIRVSTISYNYTPDKNTSKKKRMNKSIVNTRIESQKEFQNDTGSKLKKQIVYTKRGQEIMDSLINTGKARIADKDDLKDIIRRKNSKVIIKKKVFKDSPYNYSRKNLHKLEKPPHKKYNLAQSKLETKKMVQMGDFHRRAKTNLGVQQYPKRVESPSPDNINDFDGYYNEKITHER